ncbi:MAG: YgiQ family radical SAM protein [Clostridia bacterium]|nr:YgiQ family radical SAM protein [Clostridia bacterium]
MMFIPVKREELNNPNEVDFVLISSDAYVDHPTFGHAIIGRLVQSLGFSVGIIPQPLTDREYTEFPAPKYGFLVSGGVVDSMVNNYTVAKRKRQDDVYSPRSKQGKRPDRQLTVYVKNVKRLFPDSPVIIGGIEASLRRVAHYDYWSDSVMPSILADSGADILIYGMGERPLKDILALVARGVPVKKIKDVRGTCVLRHLSETDDLLAKGAAEMPSFEECRRDKLLYAKAFRQQSRNTDALNAAVLVQKQNDEYAAVQNLPAFPLTEKEMDEVYALPFERTYHPMYEAEGGIKAVEEVKFSVTSHRGCFGSCSYCAINYHQGRRVQKRSDGSILSEIELLTHDKDFKGYIHDLSGPSANFREPACEKQLKYGACKDKYCIGYEPCKNLKVDHAGFVELLRKARKIPKVKKVFIRSGIRFDYVVYDKDKTFLEELVKYHVSGQLKVAPEHCSNKVLKCMNKPDFSVYKTFAESYRAANEKLGKKQFVLPYLISSHPQCGIKEAVELTEYLKSIRFMPEQVQDFYPTPSTRSTCMFYTGIDPDTMEPVYVPRSKEEKRMQRALLQYAKPENRAETEKAYRLVKAGANGGKQQKSVKKRASFINKTQKSYTKGKKYGKMKPNER